MRWMEIAPAVPRGTVPAPPSKSYTHRALLAGHLTGAPYRVLRPLDSQDTRATAEGLASFGTRVTTGAREWRLTPVPPPAHRRVRCGASGTTLRLLAGVAGVSAAPTRFTGTGRLGQRPLEPLLEALRRGGASVDHPAGSNLPLTVRGSLLPGRYRVAGSESSQFVSALLFALPTLPGPSTLEVPGPLVSAPYVAATLAVLRAHGVRVAGRDGRWRIPGPQRFSTRSFEVPGDASSAAYLWAAAAAAGGSVSVRGLPPRWPQADLAVLPLLRSAGARVRINGGTVTVSGNLSTAFDAELTGCPDLYPLAGALAAVIPGESVLRGAPQIVGKESDRRATTIDLVRRLGGRVRRRRDGLGIIGAAHPTPVQGARWDDHRLVMSAAVASLASGQAARLGDPNAVRKSYPGFWDALAGLGVPLRSGR